MDKYETLWKHVGDSGRESITMTFDEIANIAGVPMDHSFLRYKKALEDYGYKVKKISMKTKEVHFSKLKQ